MMMKETNQNPERGLSSASLHVPHMMSSCVRLPHIRYSFLWPQPRPPVGSVCTFTVSPVMSEGFPARWLYVWVHDPSIAISHTPLPWPQWVGQRWACDLGQTQNRKARRLQKVLGGRTSLSGKFWAWSCWSHHTDRLPKNEVNMEENQNWKMERDRCWKALCEHLDPAVPEVKLSWTRQICEPISFSLFLQPVDWVLSLPRWQSLDWDAPFVNCNVQLLLFILFSSRSKFNVKNRQRIFMLLRWNFCRWPPSLVSQELQTFGCGKVRHCWSEIVHSMYFFMYAFIIFSASIILSFFSCRKKKLSMSSPHFPTSPHIQGYDRVELDIPEQ